MTPEVFPHAAYRVELIGGEFVELYVGSHLQTHLGRVDFPVGESFGVIELDATTVGGFKFAGLAHDTPFPGRVCEWTEVGGWRFYHGPLASPVRYDAQGVLHWQPIPSSDGGWSSQGYRYADAVRVYTGDETFALPEIGAWEYVRIADLVIGQAPEGGIVVVGPDNVRRRLLDGFGIRIQARTDGVRAVVSVWDSIGDRSLAVRGPLDEFRRLPPVAAPAPPVTPPVPPTKPEPPKMNPTIPDAEIARAKAEIAAHPLGDNLPDLPWTRERVRALGGRWGLNGKRGNANDPSHDIFAYRWSDDPAQQPILVDTLVDGGGANGETFQILPWPDPAGAVWISPGVGPVDPPAPPPVVSGPGAQIDRELASLLNRLAVVETQNAELRTRVLALEARPVDGSVSLAGQRIALQTNDGHFLCAENGGGGEVNATRGAVGGWETFTVVPE